MEILNDPYSENELKRIITNNYGSLSKFDLINYDSSDIAQQFVTRGQSKDMQQDKLDEFNTFMEFSNIQVDSMENLNEFI